MEEREAQTVEDERAKIVDGMLKKPLGSPLPKGALRSVVKVANLSANGAMK